MDKDQLNRYTRQLRLKQFDHSSQALLQDSRVLMMGMGGLGSPAALYLAAAGVGHLVLADFDTVDISNLHRQILYTENDLGLKKTQAAKANLQKINANIEIDCFDNPQDQQALQQQIDKADIVLDCTDNFAARFLINQYSVKFKKPLISGAAIRLEGQIAVFNEIPNSPCYACLFKDESAAEESCADIGVLGPLVGIIGSMQALEAIKVLTNIGETLSGRILLLNAETMEWRSLRLQKDPQCVVCRTIQKYNHQHVTR